MATLRTVAFLLAATLVTVQSQASNKKRESLNFLQQANSFDPENLNEEEGFYYPEENELPNGDHQIVFSGPAGQEACVICQRSSANDENMTTSLRLLQIDVELIKKKLESQNGLTSSKEAKKEKERGKPHRVQIPAPVEAPKISLLPAPAPEEAPKISLLPAPEETPEMSLLPAPAHEPLLPEEDPEEILKDISGLDLESFDPPMKEALDEIKKVLNKRTKDAEQPTTAEDKEKRDKELIDAKAYFEKQIEGEKDPERKQFLMNIIKRIQSFITKTILLELRTSSGKEIKVVSRGKIKRFESDDNGFGQIETKPVESGLPDLISVQKPAETPMEPHEE